MKKIHLTLLICMIFMLALIAPAWAGDMTLFTDTDTIDIDMTFNGSEVAISGQAPEGSDIYVKFISPEKPFNLSKMGKKAVLWMPVENIVVEDLPGMFQVLTSASIDELSGELQATMGIDTNYASVLSAARVVKQGDNPVELVGAEAEEYLSGLVGLSQEKGLLSINQGAITKEGNSYRATLVVPADIPRGISTIKAYAVKDGEIIAHTDKTIAANSIGIVQTIGHMATQNPFSYGAIAVGIALVAGFLISTAFKVINQIIFKDDTDTGAHH